MITIITKTKMKIAKRKLRLYGVGGNLNFRFYKLGESIWALYINLKNAIVIVIRVKFYNFLYYWTNSRLIINSFALSS